MPKRNEIREDQLSPKLAAGFTRNVPKEEALNYFPSKKTTGVESIRHMRDADSALKRGLPFARFAAESNADAVWSDGVTMRPQMDYEKTYTEEGIKLLREGRQCLRCDEPHPVPFPLACDLCGYPMKDRQIMDMGMECVGSKHLGPRVPITEYLTELQSRTEKRKFIDRVMGGGQGRIPKEWLKDKVLFPDGVPKKLA